MYSGPSSPSVSQEPTAAQQLVTAVLSGFVEAEGERDDGGADVVAVIDLRSGARAMTSRTVTRSRTHGRRTRFRPSPRTARTSARPREHRDVSTSRDGDSGDSSDPADQDGDSD